MDIRKTITSLVLIFTLIAFIFCENFAKNGECGYSNCDLGKPGYLNVHLIPHTHDDVGWLKTVDQYYYGARNSIYHVGVRYILDSVVQALQANKDRKFTYVEVAFFERWWLAQGEPVRAIVRRLINSGQLEFVLGGWCMNDEAVVHYTDMIDQLTRGMSFLNATFGECSKPLVAWQIDPFGHSMAQARAFIEAGFDAVFFQRMDFREKNLRRKNKSLEILWNPYTSGLINASKTLFTHMLYQSYCYPQNFCFDHMCNDDPINDNPKLGEYNVYSRVMEFVNYVKTVANSYRTNHILIPMGCDFTYENANYNFQNTDLLIKYVNDLQKEKQFKINLLYSTPACYTKAVNTALQHEIEIPIRGGDFFPYASTINSYWTGYFTSRPAFKELVRKSSTLLALCEQMHAFNPKIGSLIIRQPNQFGREDLVKIQADEIVDNLRQTMGVMQHHDAVTGTEKQHVSDDYIKSLTKYTSQCQQLISQVISKKVLSSNEPFLFCNLLNISVCRLSPIKDNNWFSILTYNPLAWNLSGVWIKVPIHIPHKANLSSIIVLDERTKKPIDFQLAEIDSYTKRIPERIMEIPLSNKELVFLAGSESNPIPAVGFALFSIHYNNTINYSNHLPKIEHRLTLTNNIVNQTNLIYKAKNGQIMNITVDLLFYEVDATDKISSGAYLFRTDGKAKNYSQRSLKIVRGPLFDEITVDYDLWGQLVTRAYADGKVEVRWTVGPFPYPIYQTKDAIVRYQIECDGLKPETEGEFFTDSMGWDLVRRVRNMRPDWNMGNNIVIDKSIEGNYYPVVNRIVLKGSGKNAMAFAVYTDRAQGGSSLQDQQVELMVHRRTYRDDGLGVGEALLEFGVDGKGLIARGVHILNFGDKDTVMKQDAYLAHKVSRPPILLFRNADSENISVISEAQWSILNKSLPEDIQLITLNTWPYMYGNKSSSSVERLLLRLENINKDEFAKKSIVDLEYMFKFAKVTGVTETDLMAHQSRKIAETSRLIWPSEQRTIHINYRNNNSDKNYKINIGPGEIKTFILTLSRYE